MAVAFMSYLPPLHTLQSRNQFYLLQPTNNLPNSPFSALNSIPIALKAENQIKTTSYSIAEEGIDTENPLKVWFENFHHD